MFTSSKQSAFSRRDFLKGISVGAVGLGIGGWLGSRTVITQAQDNPLAEVAAFYRFMVGDMRVTAIQDGVSGFPPDFFAANAEPGSVATLLEAHNLPAPEVLPTSINILLVEAGERRILLDTGLGSLSFVPDTPPPAGKLLATLELLGIGNAAITDVVISHYHPDHIFAASDMQAATFANAVYYFPKAEQDFIATNPSTGNEQIDGIIQLANGVLAPLLANDQLTLFEDEAEIIPGIHAVPAAGHSPGHTAIMLSSNGSQLLNIVDTAINYVTALQHPEWYFGFDADPDVAVESRRRVLTMAADEQIPVFGYHFPFPGVGVVDRDGDGFRFIPTL
jgi:glyoxylase-like metal-dependent hydrolase (beta-lactamase superfamily II)